MSIQPTRMRTKRARRGGFSLIELMATVGIVGLLSMVAVPAYVRYIRRSRTSEVHESLDKITNGARLYFQVEHQDASGNKVDRQFPTTIALTPVDDCCAPVPGRAGGRCAANGANWTGKEWQSLHFNLEGIHTYQYAFGSYGVEMAAKFTARAVGDLDCDTIHSTYRRSGYAMDAEGHVHVGGTSVTGPNNVVGSQFEIE